MAMQTLHHCLLSLKAHCLVIWLQKPTIRKQPQAPFVAKPLTRPSQVSLCLLRELHAEESTVAVGATISGRCCPFFFVFRSFEFSLIFLLVVLFFCVKAKTFSLAKNHKKLKSWGTS